MGVYGYMASTLGFRVEDLEKKSCMRHRCRRRSNCFVALRFASGHAKKSGFDCMYHLISTVILATSEGVSQVQQVTC